MATTVSRNSNNNSNNNNNNVITTSCCRRRQRPRLSTNYHQHDDDDDDDDDDNDADDDDNDVDVDVDANVGKRRTMASLTFSGTKATSAWMRMVHAVLFLGYCCCCCCCWVEPTVSLSVVRHGISPRTDRTCVVLSERSSWWRHRHCHCHFHFHRHNPEIASALWSTTLAPDESSPAPALSTGEGREETEDPPTCFPATAAVAEVKGNDGRSDAIVADILDYFRGRPGTADEPPSQQSEQEQKQWNNNNNNTDEDCDIPRKRRGNVQLVAGSGKTYVAWKVMEGLLLLSSKDAGRDNQSDRTPSPIGVFVTPYLNLVDQALANKEAHRILEARGDDNDDDDEEDITIDTMIVASKTGRKNVACSTDEGVIRGFLEHRDHDNAAAIKILVCTYSSLHKIGAAIESLPGGIVDICVFDEAHKMEGLNRKAKAKAKQGNHDNDKNNYNNNDKNNNNESRPKTSSWGGSFAYGLDDSNINIKNRLFMTGTPHNYTDNATVISVLPTRPNEEGDRKFLRNSGASSPGFDDNKLLVRKHKRIRSFSDEALFGPCLAKNTYRESVEQNITVPISLFGVDAEVFVEYDRFGDNNNDNVEVTREREFFRKTRKDYYLPLAIESAFSKLDVSHAVTFHSTNQRARDFAVLAQDFFARSESPVEVFNMDYRTPPAERREILEQARSAPRSLITNCKLLSMGVDEAWLDLVVIADPVRSTVDGRQMIGRVGRKAPGKERGYVLVPVPDDNDWLEPRGHSYERFVTTFRHMVHLDEELRQDVLVVVDRSTELGRPLLESEYPARVLEAFNLPESLPLPARNQLMNGAIVAYYQDEGTSSSQGEVWERMLGLLEDYRAKHGDCRVPQSYNEGGERLGMWLVRQRKRQREGVLEPSREARLNKLGVVWDFRRDQWEFMYSLLVQYQTRTGDCIVPRYHRERDGTMVFELGDWLTRQRLYKKQGKLDTELEEKLSELGVVWDVLGQQWENMYALLLEYKAREGDCNVPSRHVEDGENLGAWVSSQRNFMKNDNLELERIELLECAGFVFDLHGKYWESMFDLLSKYKERTGHCNVPAAHIEDGKKLGDWLMNQRWLKKKGRLDDEKRDLLEEIGVSWSLIAQRWNSMYELLVQFQKREGHCNVPYAQLEDGNKLGHWVIRQRFNAKKGKLGSEQMQRLEDIGFVLPRETDLS